VVNKQTGHIIIKTKKLLQFSAEILISGTKHEITRRRLSSAKAMVIGEFPVEAESCPRL